MASLKKGFGCLLALAAAFAGGTIVVVLLGAWFIQNTLSRLDSAAKPLPVPEISEPLEVRIQDIERTLTDIFTTGVAGLVVIDNEVINAWLRMSPEPRLRFIGEHAWITLSGEELTSDLSIPLEPIGVDGKFFNGTARVSAALQNGKVSIILRDATLDGEVARNVSWISKLLSGRDIAGTVGIEELLGEELLRRCQIVVISSKLELRCSERRHA